MLVSLQQDMQGLKTPSCSTVLALSYSFVRIPYSGVRAINTFNLIAFNGSAIAIVTASVTLISPITPQLCWPWTPQQEALLMLHNIQIN